MRSRFVIVWLILGALLLYAFSAAKVQQNATTEVPISTLIDNVDAGNITHVTIDDDRVTAEMKPGLDQKPRKLTSYTTDRTELVRALREKKVPYEESRPSAVGPALWMLLPIALVVGLLILVARSLKNIGGGGAAKQFGSSKAKLHHGSNNTFADVAGVDEAVAKARELVTFLKNPAKYARLGGKMPKGYLLIGRSGTGKTLLARAIAGEAKVPFFSISASEFVEMFVGVGASRVRDLFEQAKKHAPCIVFIDELDAVAKKRGGLASGGGSHDEREQTLNQILTEMDGFEPNAGVIVIAATNRPEVLDPAALRPGRFTRRIVVPAPDIRGRLKILQVHALDKPLAPELDLNIVARGTPGMTGADLENVLNEAAILAANADKPCIELSDIIAARDTVIAGEERKGAVISDIEKRVIAHHEAGHTILGWFTPEADPTHRVTIIPRGMSLGSTWHLPEEDQHLRSKKQLMAQIIGLYGGRLAEAMMFGEEHVTTGASNDLERLTAIAQSMVEDYGMGDQRKLGPPRVYGNKESGMVFETSIQDYSHDTKTTLDEQIKAVLQTCYEAAWALLKEKRPLLEAIANALLERETLEQNELEAMLGPRPTLGDESTTEVLL